jgi:hypothetical protein
MTMDGMLREAEQLMASSGESGAVVRAPASPAAATSAGAESIKVKFTGLTQILGQL